MSDSNDSVFEISGSMAFFGRWIANKPAFWRKVGDIETSILADDIAKISIEKPVYVTGLARSGSTILLETLAKLPGVATHRYKDFPPVYTPYWWNWFMNVAGPKEAVAKERAHRDGIMVTHDSPEAMEEVIWMGAFPDIHDPSKNNILDPQVRNTEFDRFYDEHIRKLLLSRGAKRYVSKGNYLVSRLDYLLGIYADARFVVPVRHPEGHIASLMKQHDLFCRGQENNESARDHLKRVGHLEFGLDRVPINMSNDDVTGSIIELWNNGEEIRGWARYWNLIYDELATRVAGGDNVADAALLVRFEDLCESPADIIQGMLDHCGLTAPEGFVAEVAAGIHAPTYYKARFSDAELAVIEEETAPARAKLGYD